MPSGPLPPAKLGQVPLPEPWSQQQPTPLDAGHLFIPSESPRSRASGAAPNKARRAGVRDPGQESPASPATREMTWGRGEGAVCADSNAVCQCQGRRGKKGSRIGGWGGWLGANRGLCARVLGGRALPS